MPFGHVKTPPGGLNAPQPCVVEVSPRGPAPEVASHYVVDFGTSATVVARFATATINAAPKVELLVGDPPFPSALRIGEQGQVTSVGTEAQRPDSPGRLHLSFKRHIELQTRTAGVRLPMLAEQVAQYIALALDQCNATVHLSPNSHVYVSVPNGFDGPAIEVIRSGVMAGLVRASRANITTLNVHVVREGEAVAKLWQHRSRFATRAKFAELKREGRATRWGQQAPSDAPFVVLDVGAGTTDLTLLQPRPGTDLILMNAGIALGGTDVDHLFVASLAHVGGWQEVPEEKRYSALSEVRELKDTENIEGLAKEIGTGWAPSLGGEPILPPAAARSAQEAAGFLKAKLELLVELSVRGLLDLIPRDLIPRDRRERRIQAVILSGRASLASPVRKAVLDWANEFGLPVITLAKDYDLKLAVTYGCVALHHDERRSLRRTTPSSTLGGWFSIDSTQRYRLAPDTWVDGEFPILWRMPPHLRSEWYFQRTAAWPRGLEQDHLEQLGGLRRAAEQREKHERTLFVLWARDDRFYSSQQHTWVPVGDRMVGDDEINPLTTLAFSFPANP